MTGRQRKPSAHHDEVHEEIAKTVSALLDASSQPPPQGVAQLWAHYLEIHNFTKKITELQEQLQKPKSALVAKTDETLLSEFLAWAKANGIQANGVTIAPFEGYRYGLKALEAVAEAQPIVVVPKDVILSVESAASSASPFYDAARTDPMLKGMPNVLLALLVFFERMKIQNGAYSKWKAYINVLPAEFTLPAFYAPTDMERLKQVPDGGMMLECCIKMYRNMARQYAYFHQLLSGRSPAFQRLNIPPDRFTFGAWRWAVSATMTRMNFVPDVDSITGEPTETGSRPAMIPFWDMGNHLHADSLHTDYDFKEANIVCYAMKDFAQDEQVFIFYGNRPNSDFLVYNGFIDPQNPRSIVKIRLGLSAKSDALSPRKFALLLKYGLQPSGATSFDFFILKREPYFPNDLMLFVAVFLADETDLAQYESVTLRSIVHSIIAKSSRKILEFVYNRIQILLRASAACSELNNEGAENELSDCSKIIVSFAAECRKIMEAASDYAKHKMDDIIVV